MDLCIADVTDLARGRGRAGRLARFFGAEIGVDEFAAESGTIGYTVLTGLGARYVRRVVGGEGSAGDSEARG